jgi:hypothetical protein
MYVVVKRVNLSSRPILASIVGSNLTWTRTRRLPFGVTLLDGLAGEGLVFGSTGAPLVTTDASPVTCAAPPFGVG